MAALEDVSRGLYGIQFHPEVVHTPYGTQILTRFLQDICGCEMSWSAASVVDEQVARIREQVGDGRVICGLSGGVDSSVAALLVHDLKALEVLLGKAQPAQDQDVAGHAVSTARDH